MKVTLLFLLGACMQASAGTYAQGITLKVKMAPLEKVFSQITKQTGVTFLYNQQLLQQAQPVTLETKNAGLENVLTRCFQNQPLKYEIINNTVAVSLKEPQGTKKKIDTVKTVRGTVTAAGAMLAGVSVSVKGTNKGAYTDIKGQYELANVSENDVLVFSSVGYQSAEIEVLGKSYIDVTLVVAVNDLDEMVVIGYGTTTKRLNTGSVSKVTGKEIGKQPVSNPLAALEGRVPGLYISQQTGAPGGGFNVNLRGRNSIANGNEPLFIIDGVPFASSPLGSAYSGSIIGGGSPFNNINPLDIESIEILKDADATAIYGSRGANGVILITTKTNQISKTLVTLNANKGIGKITRRMDLLSTTQYLEMRNEALKNDNQIPELFNSADLLLWDTLKNTDWQKELIGGSAQYNDVQLSISAGSENTQFLAGVGYHKETTVFPGEFSDVKKSMHFNISHLSIDKNFQITITSSYSTDINNLMRLDLTGHALFLPPTAPDAFDSTGKLNWLGGFLNPYSPLLQKYNGKSENIIANGIISYKLLPGLDIKTSFGTTKSTLEELIIEPRSSLPPNALSSASYFANKSVKTWIIEPQINYQLPVLNGKLTLLVGSTFQNSVSEGMAIRASGFSSEALQENISAASNVNIDSKSFSKYRYNAIFGRAGFEWKEKLIANFTGRRDGSSRFGPNKRFANFGALGIAWIITKEPLIKNLFPTLSYGKIRSSYGITGNDQIGDYEYLNSYQPTAYPYQNISGLVPVRLFNPDYGWENNKKLEFAIDIGLWNDRLMITAAYFKNKSSNQLVGYPLAYLTGFSSIKSNLPAAIQNTGLELELSSAILTNKKFNWNTSLNISFPKNKLISYPNFDHSPYAYVYEIGKSLYLKKTYRLNEVDQQTGLYEFEDVNKDGMINYPKDLSTSRNLTQEFFGGIQNSLRYKGFEFDFLFQFVKQTGRSYITGFSVPGFLGNQPTAIIDRWQKEGNETTIQRYTQTYGPAYTAYMNSRSYGENGFVDASFIRLKNLSIAYDFPKTWLKKLSMLKIKPYFLAQNLLTFTKYLGMDPENQSFSSLPPLKVFTAGFSITLL